MQQDNNIPVLTDLIEAGESRENITLGNDSTDLVIETASDDLDSTGPGDNLASLRVDEPVENDIEAAMSAIDFPVESSDTADVMVDNFLPESPLDNDKRDTDLETTIRKIINRHMALAMNEIRLVLQSHKR